jgi:hypothetical protein
MLLDVITLQAKASVLLSAVQDNMCLRLVLFATWSHGDLLITDKLSEARVGT